ncbi:MAG: helix-turn-helix domain-containing protein, partial [Thiohalorhabdaceae bacterium]
MHRTDTYRLDPTADQHNALKRMAGCGRFVWNRALELIQTYRAW